MIRQTTTIPVVAPPGEATSTRGRYVFAAINIVLLASIPVLGFIGFQSLLDTRSGAFTVEPGPNDPGWIAVVEATPIVAIVDVYDDATGGLALVVPSGEGSGGAVLLVSGSTAVSGSALSERSPQAAVDALAAELRLDLGTAIIADGAWWDLVLGGRSVEVANPDPVVGSDGDVIVEAGRVVLGGSEVAAMSTLAPVAVDDPEALEFRRMTLWNALLDAEGVFGSAGTSGDGAGPTLARLAAGIHLVESMPMRSGALAIDEAEDLVRRVVAFPRAHELGARMRVRIIDRTGGNDLQAVARALGAAGFEVGQIANAAEFSDGPTQVLETPAVDAAELARLAELAGAASVSPSLDTEAVETVTLLLGNDAALPAAPG